MNVYSHLDSVRRWQGGMLDTLGLGPREAPSEPVISESWATLLSYGGGPSPIVLILPAPIKQAYIWDISPEASVVRELLGRGIAVYLVRWERPRAGDQGIGLGSYSEQFILSCLDAIRSEHGEGRVFLAGHSLGGTFSAIFASLHPERVKGLILLGAPIAFGPGLGALDSLVAESPDTRSLTNGLDDVPGSFMSVMSSVASPESFQEERMSDWLKSLSDRERFVTHMRVERWSLDELPMPRMLFEDVVELLYRENRFMKGTLEINGRRALPGKVDAPILSVADARSKVVSPEASLSFHDAAASLDKQVLWYEGDVGVVFQHVGFLVGRNAHRFLWPEIVAWISAHA